MGVQTYMDQNHMLRWTTRNRILIIDTTQVLHVFYMFLRSLLVNEISQGSWYIKVLRSFLTDLFVGEIYDWRAREQIGCTC